MKHKKYLHFSIILLTIIFIINYKSVGNNKNYFKLTECNNLPFLIIKDKSSNLNYNEKNQNKSNKYIFVNEDIIENNINFYFDCNLSHIIKKNEFIDNIKVGKYKLKNKLTINDFKLISYLDNSKIVNNLKFNLFFGKYKGNYTILKIDNLKKHLFIKLVGLNQIQNGKNVNFDYSFNLKNNLLFFKLEKLLFKIDFQNNTSEIIMDNIVSLQQNNTLNEVNYIKESGNFLTLNTFQLKSGIETNKINIEYGNNYKFNYTIKKENTNNTTKKYYILNGFQNITLFSIYKHQNNKVLKKDYWLNSKIKNLHFINNFNKMKFSDEILLFEFFDFKEANNLNIYKLDKLILNSNNLVPEKIVKLDSKINSIFYIKQIEEFYYIITDNYIYILDLDFKIIAENNNYYETFNYQANYNENNKINNVLNNLEGDVVIIGNNVYSKIYKIEKNPFWFFYKIYYDFIYLFIPFLIFVILLFLIRQIKKQKRIINNLIDLPNNGFVFIFNKNGQLLQVNNEGRDLLRIDYTIPLNKYFKFYCNLEQFNQLFDFFENSHSKKQQLKQTINIVIDNKVNEYLCNSTPQRNFTGNFKGMIITGLNITEELERQRLVNWAQLAHDMQTNLSIIKLNAENLATNVNDDDRVRLDKIAQQTNILFNRIRDLVTVGKSKVLNKNIYKSNLIVDQLISEFDHSLIDNIKFNKNVQFFDINCDKAKIIRCLRNSIENSIKAIKDNKGEITIHCKLENKFVIFTIEDNGPGMDENIKKRMLSPFFTSNPDDGGSGIGTMIMLNVMEQHGGSLYVDSKIGQGTKMIFKFPN
jgi:signal transduction histidine kinase